MPDTTTPAADLRSIRAIRAALRLRRNPDNAQSMQAYMKSVMPFLGVQTKPMRAACREVYRAHPLDSFDEWKATVLTLWREAHFREERYAAIELTGFRAYGEYQTMQALPLYRELVISGAWWDLVDPIATQRLGGLLRRYPAGMGKQMRAWARSRHVWKRRCSILCQVKFKQQTNTELLYDCIRPSMRETDFFLRKAIGWALREYAKTAADEVVRFVRRHEADLNGLSKREALKHVG